METDRSAKINPSSIRNLLEKRPESWKPLLGHSAGCIGCRQWWWCPGCRLRCTCGEAFEPPSDGKEAPDCANVDEGTSKQDGISGDGESGEHSVPDRCFVHDGPSLLPPCSFPHCSSYSPSSYEPEDFDTMDSGDEWWPSYHSDYLDSE